MRRSFNTMLVALCCSALGCTVNTNTGSKYAKTQEINASTGGTVTVTNSDDPTLAGLQVKIPPNALAQNTLITIAEGNGFTLADGAAAAGPIADLGPGSAIFAHPITVVLPFALANGQDPTGLTVQGIDPSGKTVHVSKGDLKIDPIAHTVAFTAVHLHRFAAVWNGGSTNVCPAGEVLCGCCGNGTCQPAGQVCPAIACPAFCENDGGAGGGSGGGNSCCPAGESWCGCGGSGKCIPDDEGCPLACPAQGDPTNGGTTTPPEPVCCGPGTYLCGCGGIGKCIADDQACPLLCPVCDPTLIDSPCGCIPPGTVCQCGANQPSTVACQCDPATNSSGSTVCEVDAGNPCPSATDVLTPCGCLPPGAICAPADGGTNCASTQSQQCCDGTCVGPGQVCPSICFNDGGVTTIDGGVCPAGEVMCPANSSGGVKCVPAGVPCQGP